MAETTSVEVRLREGWTLRKVATALAREWLPPFLAETGPKAPRWILQPVVETPEEDAPPLWEPGISTEEYERRVESPRLAWVIRANVARGRNKGKILARLAYKKPHELIDLTVFPVSIAESPFDDGKVQEFLDGQESDGMEGLFVGLLEGEGFRISGQVGTASAD